MKDSDLKGLKFCCPVCGTDKAPGANDNCKTDKQVVERHCHGQLKDGSSCGFRWSSKDDEKYFTK